MEYEELLFYAEEQVTVGRKRPAFLGYVCLGFVCCLTDSVHRRDDVISYGAALGDDVRCTACFCDILFEHIGAFIYLICKI